MLQSHFLKVYFPFPCPDTGSISSTRCILDSKWEKSLRIYNGSNRIYGHFIRNSFLNVRISALNIRFFRSNVRFIHYIFIEKATHMHVSIVKLMFFI